MLEQETEAGALDALPKSKRPRYQSDNSNKAFQIKDVLLVLIFLMGIAAIYTNVNERLVKLETKGDAIAGQITEMKNDTARVTGKLDETIKGLQSQIRDVEQLIVINRNQKP